MSGDGSTGADREDTGPPELAQALAASMQTAGDAWAKVPRAVLGDTRLTYLQLRVLVALLSYADPSRPEHPVWAGPKRIASDLGLKATRGPVERVRKAVNDLQRLGYLVRLNPPRKKLRVSLSPVLTLSLPRGGRAKRTQAAALPGIQMVQQPTSVSRAPNDVHWNPVYAGTTDAPGTGVSHTSESSASNHPTNEQTNNKISDQPTGSVHLHEPSDREQETVSATSGVPTSHDGNRTQTNNGATAEERLRESVRVGVFSMAPEGTDHAAWAQLRKDYQLAMLAETLRRGRA